LALDNKPGILRQLADELEAAPPMPAEDLPS
jgi:hypothetical protein